MKKYILITTVTAVSLVCILCYGINKRAFIDEQLAQITNTSKDINTVMKYEPALEAKELILDNSELNRIMAEEREKDLKRFEEERKEREANQPRQVPSNSAHKPVLLAASNITENSNSSNYTQKINNMVKVSKDLIGTPYVWGGTTPYKGMDCSGFTQYVMRQVGYNIPRVSRDQSRYGRLVSRLELMPGDLLFFDTTNPRDASDIKTPTQEMQYAMQVEDGFAPVNVSHVGIYLGDGVMIHASSGDGIITYADLSSNYYKNRFMNARRIIE